MKKTVIVVAGGQGVRVGSELPKQFMHLGGRPMLMHTIDLFHRYDSNIDIVVGLVEKYMFSPCQDDHPDRTITPPFVAVSSGCDPNTW